MTKKYVKKYLKEIPYDEFDGTREEIIEKINDAFDLAESLRKDPNSKITMEYEYDEGLIFYELRYETDEEYENRIKEETEYKDGVKQRELKFLKELKERYGSLDKLLEENE